VHSIMWNTASLLSTSVGKLYFKSSSPQKNETWVVMRIGKVLFVERVRLFREMLGTLVQTYISSTAYYHTYRAIRTEQRPSLEKIKACLSKHPTVIFTMQVYIHVILKKCNVLVIFFCFLYAIDMNGNTKY